MSWKIEINWNECPHLIQKGIPPLKKLICYNDKNKNMFYHCNEKNCPIKLKSELKKGKKNYEIKKLVKKI